MLSKTRICKFYSNKGLANALPKRLCKSYPETTLQILSNSEFANAIQRLFCKFHVKNDIDSCIPNMALQTLSKNVFANSILRRLRKLCPKSLTNLTRIHAVTKVRVKFRERNEQGTPRISRVFRQCVSSVQAAAQSKYLYTTALSGT